MTRNPFPAAILLLVFSTNGALADQIDGNWCSPKGKSISIDGPNVTSPSGKSVVANYDRHHIDYQIPAGEPNAGATFSADQLNDNEIRVSIIAAKQKQPLSSEIWTPCKPIS